MTLASAYLFVNDGRLDTDNAQKLILDTSLAFHVLGMCCTMFGSVCIWQSTFGITGLDHT
jgi:hypothetical protein